MGTNKDPPVKKNAFVHKLFTMLHDDSLNHLIWWSGSPCGITFSIYPGNEFASMLSKYFKHGNVASFVRQLHMYGFHKVSDPNHSYSQQIVWEFRHSSGRFRRGDESALVHIRRRPQSNQSRSHTVDTNQTTQDVPVGRAYIQPTNYSIPGGHPQEYSSLPANPDQTHFIQHQPQANALHIPVHAPHFNNPANGQSYTIIQPQQFYQSPYALHAYPQQADTNFITMMPYGSTIASPAFSGPQHRSDNQPFSRVKSVHSPQQAHFASFDNRGFQAEGHKSRFFQTADGDSPRAHQLDIREKREESISVAQTSNPHSSSESWSKRHQPSVVSPTAIRSDPRSYAPQSEKASKLFTTEKVSKGSPSQITQTPLVSSSTSKTSMIKTSEEYVPVDSFPGFWKPFESSKSRQHRIPSMLCDPLAPLTQPAKHVSASESNASDTSRNPTPLSTVPEIVRNDESSTRLQGQWPVRTSSMAPPHQGSLSHFRMSQSPSVGPGESENMRKAIFQANGVKSLADKIRPSLAEIHSSQGPYANTMKSMDSIGSHSSSVFSNNSSISSTSTGRLSSYGSISYLPPPIGYSAVSPHEESPSYFRPPPLQKVTGLEASHNSIESQSKTEVDTQVVKIPERPFNSQPPKVEFMLSRRKSET